MGFDPYVGNWKPSTLLSELSGDQNAKFHSCGFHICVDNDILTLMKELTQMSKGAPKLLEF